jgi:hypothetical protein
MCDALSKGHSMCARAKGNHHIIHPILASIRTRLFLSSLFFSLRSIVTLSLSLLEQAHALFFLPYIYIYTYIHTSDGYKRLLLSRIKIFLSFFFLLQTVDREKKLAAKCEKRTRLLILRNDVWARVRTSVLFLLLT